MKTWGLLGDRGLLCLSDVGIQRMAESLYVRKLQGAWQFVLYLLTGEQLLGELSHSMQSRQTLHD